MSSRKQDLPRAGQRVGQRAYPKRRLGLPPESNWRLPSGQTLAQFALRSGFVAPPLLREKAFRLSQSPGGSPVGVAVEELS